ncbi:hypothetical protein MU448_00755 [Streptococcus sp. O1]|uniref:hypothetical protein n=1 Tax=Streptococcus sp. O1 TaxID=2928735 RepID=UPI00211AB34F|nr:hypothetical protein [Streptococcus sp. O1]MCQ9213010.1 hypothetical protein [Streptococcus sp. O1]
MADRRRRLSLLLEQEQEKMERLLIRYKASREEAEGFYRKVQELQDESEWIYKEKSQQLEAEIEEWNRFFYHDCNRIKRELRDLRRTYNDRDCSLLFARR